jgi:hypothetical protein
VDQIGSTWAGIRLTGSGKTRALIRRFDHEANMMRAMLVWSLAAALAAAIFLAPANAQLVSGSTPEALALTKLLRARSKSPLDSTNDPRWRASLANALHQYCESVLVQVPRNTPEEDRWVDSEFQDLHSIIPPPSLNQGEFEERSAKYARRMNRIESSVEYARKIFRSVLTDCSALTTKLMELKKGSPAAEALLWVRLSNYFGGEDLTWDLAEVLGLISPNYCKHVGFKKSPLMQPPDAPGAHDENDICMWSWVHNSIIIGAVIPLLEASSGQ